MASEFTKVRRDKIATLAALVSHGLIFGNGMQELPNLARISVELALEIEKEVDRVVPVTRDNPE